jgi:CO/xanthine dehydrogenase FAD-binding subunit
MSPVERFTPETLDEAAALLMAADERARPRFAGAELIVEATRGGTTPLLVLDASRIPELNRLEYDERLGLAVGSAVPLGTLLSFPPVPGTYPMLVDGLEPGASRPAARPGTLGEALTGEQPGLDLILPLICLRAAVGIFGPHGWSEMSVEGLVAAWPQVGLHPGEFVVRVRLPPPPSRSGGAYLRAPAAVAGSAAQGGVGAFLIMEDDLATCCGMRLIHAGPGSAPRRDLEVERFLAGKPLDAPVVEEAGVVVLRSLGALPGQPEGLAILTGTAIRRALERIRAKNKRQ